MTKITSIDPSLYLNNQSNQRTPSPDLGKDEFLKLLMAQIQNQDPANTMDEGEFVSQMATFSSLEQMMNMSKSMELLVNNQLVSPAIKYSHMIGETVKYRTFDEESGKETGIESSKVVSVSEQDGWAVLHLENGEKIYADTVIEVGKSEKESGNDITDPSENEEGEA